MLFGGICQCGEMIACKGMEGREIWDSGEGECINTKVLYEAVLGNFDAGTLEFVGNPSVMDIIMNLINSFLFFFYYYFFHSFNLSCLLPLTPFSIFLFFIYLFLPFPINGEIMDVLCLWSSLTEIIFCFR